MTNHAVGADPVFEKLQDKVTSSMLDPSAAPKRIQTLYELLRDIQQDDMFRDKYGKEKSKEIIKGMQKRLLAARDESASLVFGSGKLGSVNGGQELSLNSTLKEIELDLLALRDDSDIASGETVDQTPGGVTEEVGSRPVYQESEGSSEASETTESSTDGFDGWHGKPIQSLSEYETQPRSDDALPADKKQAEHGSAVAAHEDWKTLFANERKRSAHLAYLNKTLESKVQTIEAERLKMREQLTYCDKPVNNQEKAAPKAGERSESSSQTAERKRIAHLEFLNKTLESKIQTIEAQKLETSAQLEKAALPSLGDCESAAEPKIIKALEEKLQQSVASLDIFKVEATKLHQEILQLRKQVELSKQEADRYKTVASNLKTLNRQLEQQLIKVSQEKGVLTKEREKEKSQRNVSLAEHERLAKSMTAQVDALSIAHAAEIETMAHKIQSSESNLLMLREKLDRKTEETEAALLELDTTKITLAEEREAQDQEVRELKATIQDQRVLLQNAQSDYDGLETELRDIILQQRNDLKVQAESLKEQKSKPDNELMKSEFDQKLRAIIQKHSAEMAESEELHLERIREQETSMLKKQDELQQLLDNARSFNKKLEAKLQKSREDNARCLSLVARLGKRSLVDGETETTLE